MSVFAVSHVRSIDFSSMALRLQACLGCPCFLFPCRFHSKAWHVILLGFFRSLSPTQRQFLLLVCKRIASWRALSHSLVFGTLSNHFKWRICCKHLLRKVCTFLELLIATLHVSDPYISTYLMLELNIRSLVCVEIAMVMSSVPPDWLILPLKFTNSLTSFTDEPSIVSWASCFVLLWCALLKSFPC